MRVVGAMRIVGMGYVMVHEDKEGRVGCVIRWMDSFKRTWYSPCDIDGNSHWMHCATRKDALRYVTFE